MTHCFSYLMSEQVDDTALFNTLFANANEFSNLSKEIFPTIKTLLKLCAEQGIFVKIINRSTVVRRCLMSDLGFDITAAYEGVENLTNLAYYNFGLAFGIGIYEKTAFGQLKYVDHKILYNKVGKIGESIGLTWAGNHPFLSNLRYFELRPQWANNMSDKEMMNELYRRKNAKLSLLT